MINNLKEQLGCFFLIEHGDTERTERTENTYNSVRSVSPCSIHIKWR